MILFFRNKSICQVPFSVKFGKKVFGMKTAETAKTEGASVKVLGSGCDKCNQLEKATREALSELKMDTAIDHVKDFAQIAAYGVMSTPALVVDGKVVSFGIMAGV